MRDILYSVGLKAAAFAVCIASAASAVGMITDTIQLMQNGGGYSPGIEFENSSEMHNRLGYGVNSLISAVAYDEAAVFNRSSLELNDLEYYAENLDTGKIYTNTESKQKSAYARGVIAGADTYVTIEKRDGELELDGNRNIYYVRYGDEDDLIYKYIDSTDSDGNKQQEIKERDDYVVYVKIKDDKAEELFELWCEAKQGIHDATIALPILAGVFLISLIYLTAAAGRRARDKEIHLRTIDRLTPDITVLLTVVVCVCDFVLTVIVIGLSGDMINGAAAVGTGVGAAALIWCWLSVVRNIKAHKLAERSLVCRAVRWVWRQITRLLGWLFVTVPKRFKTVFFEIKALAAKNMRYGMIIGGAAAYMAATVLLSWITGAMMNYGGFALLIMFLICAALAALPAVIVFKALRGYNGIREGVIKLRGGETSHKIPLSGSVITDALAEDINDIGEGLSKAVEISVRSERMKSELITNVSHDLKTPLTAIINYTDLLMKEKLSPEEANDYVRIIDQKSKKLKQLTADLFTVSKARSGSEEPELEDIDHKLLITQAEAEFDSEIREAGLEFIMQLPEEAVTVTADGKKLSRVYANLIGNAVKYSLKDTRVYISMSVSGGVCRTEIKNIAGYRMDFDDEEITERFVRGDESRTGDGSGLGLAIAKSYTELMGGRFYIKTDGDLFKAVTEFKIKD